MAGFKTHLTVSTLAGIGYGAGAYWFYGVPPAACLLAGGLCSVSGMLPDIDSGSGRPLKESLAFAAAVVSTMLVDRFQKLDLSMETIILASAFFYLLIRFGLAEILRRYTVHRGMFHSLPAAAIFGELAFLLSSGDTTLRWYKGAAVVVGYLSHLVLDELYSVTYVRGRMTFKRSFGTAVKLFGRGWLPNLTVYAKFALLTFLVFKEPGWMQKVYHDRLEQTAEDWFDLLFDESDLLLAEKPKEPDLPEPSEASTDRIGITLFHNPRTGLYQTKPPAKEQPRTGKASGGLRR